MPSPDLLNVLVDVEVSVIQDSGDTIYRVLGRCLLPDQQPTIRGTDVDLYVVMQSKALTQLLGMVTCPL